MLRDKHLIVIVILISSCLYSVNCGKETIFIRCDPSKASAEKSNNECPENAQCVELGKNNTTKEQQVSISSPPFDGLCACRVNYTVSENYSSSVNNSKYCIERADIKTTAAPLNIPSTSLKPTAPTSSTSPPSTTHKIEPSTAKSSNDSSPTTKNTNDKKPSQQQPQQQQKEKENASPQTHHILGGIVLPVMIVLAFIGVVYGIRKYDVIEHTLNLIRNRRAGHIHQTRYDGLENDFDDDPLLI